MSLLDHDLEFFLAIAAYRSLAKASAALGVSQPTLSRSVQKLERRLGATLLERTTVGVALSAAGRQLVQRAQVAQVALEDASREIREVAEGKRGHARVVAGFTLWPIVSRALVPRLHQDRPVATLDLNAMLLDEIIEALCAGMYDFGVCVVPSELPAELEAEVLLRDELVPVVRADHPLTRGRVDAAQLLDHAWIGVHSRIATHKAIVAKFNELGLSAPQYAVRTDSMEIALRTVEQSDFITFAPRWRTQSPGSHSTVVPLEVAGMAYQRSVGVVLRRHAYRGPIAERALALVREALAAIDQHNASARRSARRQ